MKIKCVRCKVVIVTQEPAGKAFTCPSCGRQAVVPSPQDREVEVPDRKAAASSKSGSASFDLDAEMFEFLVLGDDIYTHRRKPQTIIVAESRDAAFAIAEEADIAPSHVVIKSRADPDAVAGIKGVDSNQHYPSLELLAGIFYAIGWATLVGAILCGISGTIVPLNRRFPMEASTAWALVIAALTGGVSSLLFFTISAAIRLAIEIGLHLQGIAELLSKSEMSSVEGRK